VGAAGTAKVRLAPPDPSSRGFRVASACRALLTMRWRYLFTRRKMSMCGIFQARFQARKAQDPLGPGPVRKLPCERFYSLP